GRCQFVCLHPSPAPPLTRRSASSANRSSMHASFVDSANTALADEPCERLQGGRQEERCLHVGLRHYGADRRHRQICSRPGNRERLAVVSTHQNSRCSTTPEDVRHPPNLPAIHALFRGYRQPNAAKCTIRCCVLWGQRAPCPRQSCTSWQATCRAPNAR